MKFILIFFLFILSGYVNSSERILQYYMFEYPPFFSNELPHKGAMAKYFDQYLGASREYFKSKVTFVSFPRMHKILREEETIGFIGLIRGEDKKDIPVGYKLSRKIDTINFCFLNNSNITSISIDDLKGYRTISLGGDDAIEVFKLNKKSHQYTPKVESAIEMVLKGRGDGFITIEEVYNYFHFFGKKFSNLQCPSLNLKVDIYLAVNNKLLKKLNLKKFNHYTRKNNFRVFRQNYLKEVYSSVNVH